MGKLEDIVEKCGKGLRYTLASYLPKEVKEKMADKHGEDPEGYLLCTVLSETGLMIVISIGGMAVAGPVAGVIGVGIGCHALFDTLRLVGNRGHPITTIPYHMVKKTYRLAKKIKEHYDQPVDYIMLYREQPRKFKRYFSRQGDDNKKEVINNILASGEANERLDKWISDNCPELVTEVGRGRVLDPLLNPPKLIKREKYYI